MEAPAPRVLAKRYSYGPFVRLAEKDRHIYKSTLDYRRWLIGGGSLGLAVLLGWGANWSLKTSLGESAFDVGLGVFLAIGSIVMLLASAVVFALHTRLEITATVVILVTRGITGRLSKKSWPISELEGSFVGDFATFHMGGSTPGFVVNLLLSGDRYEKLVPSIDFRDVAEHMSQDISESAASLQNEASLNA